MGEAREIKDSSGSREDSPRSGEVAKVDPRLVLLAMIRIGEPLAHDLLRGLAIVVCDHCEKMLKRKGVKEWHLTSVHVRAVVKFKFHKIRVHGGHMMSNCSPCEMGLKVIRNLENHKSGIHVLISTRPNPSTAWGWGRGSRLRSWECRENENNPCETIEVSLAVSENLEKHKEINKDLLKRCNLLTFSDEIRVCNCPDCDNTGKVLHDIIEVSLAVNDVKTYLELCCALPTRSAVGKILAFNTLKLSKNFRSLQYLIRHVWKPRQAELICPRPGLRLTALALTDFCLR